jgi:hypothetical protein
MANFKDAFAEARKAGKKQFDFGGKSYTTDVAKGDSTPRYQSGALKGMRRDPNEGKTQAERSKRLREREQKLMAARPKPPAPKPVAAKPPAKTEPKGPGLGARFGSALGSAADTARAGVRAAGEKAKEIGGTVAGKAKEVVGEAKQLPGRAVESTMNAVGAPSHMSVFAGTLLGNRSKITDADDKTKAQLKYAAAQAAKRSGKNAGLSYKDYKTKLDQGSLSGEQSAAQLVGKNAPGNITRDNKGNATGIKDKYDFFNPTREKEVRRYEKMGAAEKAATVAKETVSDAVDKGIAAALKNAPSRIANAYIGREGARDVDIKLAKGGTVKKCAKGGTTGQTKQQPYAGMKQKMLSEYTPPKPKAYAKGGMVGSRADGCATKGKTKCKMR